MKILKPYSQNQNLGLVLALVGLISAAAVVMGPIRLASAQSDARSWSYTGSLNLARASHTATVLSDGKVLVAGGRSDTTAPQAELYDPETGKWSITASFNVARLAYTATLLRNGKVLVVGGFDRRGDDYSALNSAELYDPETRTWSVTGSLNIPRFNHTATLLQNGKVLVAAGLDGKDSLNSAELYDPDTGMWSFTGNLNIALYFHTATLLQNGGVLVAVGDKLAELYDPNTGTWSSVGNINGNYRVRHTATLLPDGRVLIAGGTNDDDFDYAYFNTAELYDPNTRKWSSAGHLNSARENHTATALPGGKVLVAGGLSSSGSLVISELYDPDTGTWSFTSSLNSARGYHSATLLPDGKVMIAGGMNLSFTNDSSTNNSLDSVELGYDLAAARPTILTASVAGKKLIARGEYFVSGAVILVNGEEQKTKNDVNNPQAALICKKAGKKIKPGDRVQVRNPDGTLSEEFTLTN